MHPTKYSSAVPTLVLVSCHGSGPRLNESQSLLPLGSLLQMVFEGWKSCGKVFNYGEIEVDDIVFTVTYVPPSPQTSATPSEGTATTTGSAISSSSSDVTASSAAVTSSLETSTDHSK
eukprot:TRINITY_DN25879_c1_g2_i1.p1 TRINITY_DN25879_c1_g2~~TRINITY_DN25879_c1_g2_i1.p1  ORF type:complete len:118 (+),score=11.39 TRINITY_DN25879_c1_g2_i1:17-370(+)